jgi:hypothetical protein
MTAYVSAVGRFTYISPKQVLGIHMERRIKVDAGFHFDDISHCLE